jgi:TolB-like protein/tetratricopeptide (TPR) repeat protein/DNA-binding winged helix-turn-helix (wHTH) protein
MENSTEAAGGPEQAGFQVDDLIIDLGQQRVTRDGSDIPLPHLSFDLLVALARAAPNLVTFDQLIERVWTGLVISPETISQRVKLVRSALGDDPQAPRYITAVRGRGYRMVAEVRPLGERRRNEPPPTPYWIKEDAPEPSGQAAASAAVAAAPPPSAGPGPVAWLGGLLVVAVLLALPWAATRYLRAPAPAAEQSVRVQPPHSIAVLPLIDVTPGDGNRYLGDGLAQELAARLARIHGLRVASLTSAFAFRDREADVRTIAQTLGVRQVLEGSVMRTGDQLRVTAQLIDADSGYNVWSQTYSRTWQDLIAIQDDVARSIIGTLQVMLSNDMAQQAARSPTTQVEAFNLYLAGLSKLRGTAGQVQLDQAEDDFRQALALDPKFALAYAGLCERYASGYEETRDTALVKRAEESCQAALKLDDSLREVSNALAHLYLVSGRNEEAAARYRAAIRADPDNADGYIGVGEAFEAAERPAEAERAFRQGVAVEPTYWGAQTALGNFLLRQGHAADAIPVYQRVTELVPASRHAYNNLGAAYLMVADFPHAASAFERSIALEPSRSAYSNLGSVYYFLGRYPDAARMFTRSTELAAQDHRVWGNLADALWQVEGSRSEAQADYRRAMTLAQRSLEVNPKDAVSWMQLAYYSARAGEAAHIDGYASRARELGPQDQFVQYYGALVALERGNGDAALSALARAIELGYPAQLVRAAPDFASLRNDPRFRRLVTPTTDHAPTSRQNDPPAMTAHTKV